MSGSVRRSVLGCCARILRPTAPHQVYNDDDVCGGDNGDDDRVDPHAMVMFDRGDGDGPPNSSISKFLSKVTANILQRIMN